MKHEPPPFHRRSLTKLAVSATVGVISAFAVAPRTHSSALSTLVGWDFATLTMLIWSWTTIGRATAKETKARAGAEDPGRTAVWLLVTLSCLAGFFSSAIVLRRAKQLAPLEADMLAAVCLVTVILAWLLAHTIFALRYARLFYGPRGGKDGGLDFPGDEPPDDFDFAYFAFTVGMCFQVSDVTISNRSIRRTVLLHGLISFGYNTAIVALALNLLVNLFG